MIMLLITHCNYTAVRSVCLIIIMMCLHFKTTIVLKKREQQVIIRLKHYQKKGIMQIIVMIDEMISSAGNIMNVCVGADSRGNRCRHLS